MRHRYEKIPCKKVGINLEDNKKQNRETVYDKVSISKGMLDIIISAGILLTVVLVAVSSM